MSASSSREDGHRRNESLSTIAAWWYEHWIEECNGLDLPFEYIGTGEPFCFRCGWLAPVDDTPSEKNPWKVWSRASGWLEAAHLEDHASLKAEGRLFEDGPSNQVPLCYWCHRREMPDHDVGERDKALDWVASGRRCPQSRQMITDHLYETNRLPVGKGKSARLARHVDRYLAMAYLGGDAA